MTAPRLTICFDNYPGIAGLPTLWGFAAIIEVSGQTILFDTGSNGRVLLGNLTALGWHPSRFDMVFLSHPHWDHIGGLDSVLELNPGLRIVVHEGFSKHLIRDLQALCDEVQIVGAEPLALGPCIASTGQLDSEPPEHGLVIDTGAVTALISGCAHPGMEQMVAGVTVRIGKPIDWAIGGFHLMYADVEQIGRAIAELQSLGVTTVVPTHCTGDAARDAFRAAYGRRCVDGGVGRIIEITR
jgi:7,8-dihydropterin-6-yl-methyl-4-(beta-D-ribofuranosyl)aminobenzene 5'-phosphate synthase